MMLASLVCSVGCLASNAVVCDDGTTCPEGTICYVSLGLCVTESQIAACAGKADGESCDLTAADERCVQGVCVPVACGNGVTDPNEVCDDGNTLPGDGCSADCESLELCGNSVTDLVVGEGCDDGNFTSHDGCSSTCAVESPRWSRRPTSPAGRMAPGLTYDSDRDRIVLIGGVSNRITAEGVVSVDLDDAWESDGRWREVTAVPPPPRRFFSLVYDRKHERTLMYGASLGLGELWAFDGTAWTLLSVDGPLRTAAAVGYDPVRELLVVQGGYDPAGSVPTGETWIWNGTTWAGLAVPNTGISAPRAEAAMVFDPKRGKLVLFGGRTTGTTMRNDVWEFDGTAWAQRVANGASGANIPTARAAMSMAWNATCQCVVLYGGVLASGVVTNDTFTWNGTAWTNITSSSNPPTARAFAGFTDDGHGGSLLVGGSKYESTSSLDATAYYEQTWRFDGATWLLDISRVRPVVAFDTHRHRVVMYGGGTVGVSESSRDTYELSNRGWTLLSSTTGPDHVTGAAMVYDEARRETVLVGGMRGGGEAETDTWIWNGTAWATRTVSSQVPPRAHSVLVYDAARSELVAFGGYDPNTYVDSNATWTWNGTTWTNRMPAMAPSPRNRVAAAYDRVNQQVVAFGGYTNAVGWNNDTWLWDGTTWTQKTGGGMPTPSPYEPLMAWDPARRKVVLLSGEFLQAWEWTTMPDGQSWWRSLGSVGNRASPDGGVAYSGFDGAGVTVMGGYYFVTFEPSDTWELRWDSSGEQDSCPIARDLDGDTLAGCSDPDCWATCAPACVPGDACAADAPRCGDGACGAAETCRSCATDCASCGQLCGDGICDSGETCPGDC